MALIGPGREGCRTTRSLRSAERITGTRNITRDIVGGIEDRMGNQVRVVVTHDGRDIVYRIKSRVENNTPQHQHRQKTRLLVLPEQAGDGNHYRKEGQYSQNHAGNYADLYKTCRGNGIAFHEMYLHRCHVERGCGCNGSKKHCSRNEDPVPFIEFHTTQLCLRVYIYSGNLNQNTGMC